MKHTYLSALAVVLFGLGTSLSAQAQYLFTDSNLGPYTQNFDSLSGTVLFSAGAPAGPALLGLYAEAQTDPQFGSRTGTPDTIRANDGSTVAGNYYHFGYPNDADRAFGGIAESGARTGLGFVGIRLKNSSSVTIQNLEVQYAMEQWYNSGNAAAAYVNAAYRKSSGVAGENFAELSNGTPGNAWTAIPALTVTVPSTGTTIQNRDGNAPSNRRVAQTTLTGINIAPGEEVMIRWDYVLNTSTNGNGVSIDDVVITPETSVNLVQGGTSLASTIPSANLTAPNQTYYLAGTVEAADLAAISGANSKIIVGTPALNGAAAQNATLVLDDNTALAVPVDVANGSTLRIEEAAAATPLTLGLLAPASTVEYLSTTATQTIRPASYGNLTLAGAGPKELGGDVLVNEALQLADAKLTLGNFDATLTKGAAVLGADATSYVVADNDGSLRQSVLSDNVKVVFPVGTSTAYLPLTLRQSVARSEDVFAVRVSNDKYDDYNASDAGIGAPVAEPKSVNQTWFVSEEVKGNANVTLTTQWSTAEQSADFEPAKAYISHYTNGDWDRTATEAAPELAPSSTDTYLLSRSNITSFSPFTVSSAQPQPLPVELVSFRAQRGNGVVTCSWATASEKNSKSFTLERSLNGLSFTEIGELPAAGTSSMPHTYSLLDRHPALGTAYYRLRQLDNTGQIQFSPVVTVQGEGASTETAVAAAPNPSSGLFTVTVSTIGSGMIQGAVSTLLGAEVLRFSQPVSAESQPFTLDLSAQPAGVYLLRVQLPQGPKTLRVVKL